MIVIYAEMVPVIFARLAADGTATTLTCELFIVLSACHLICIAKVCGSLTSSSTIEIGASCARIARVSLILALSLLAQTITLTAVSVRQHIVWRAFVADVTQLVHTPIVPH